VLKDGHSNVIKTCITFAYTFNSKDFIHHNIITQSMENWH